MAQKKTVQLGSTPRPGGEGYSGGRENPSIWSATASDSVPSSPSLDANIRAHVCVVGGDIAGLSTAYFLARAGQSVVIIDKGLFGHGETAHTTAHLSNEMDSTYRTIERRHGEKGAQLAAHSHTSAIAQIEMNVAQEDIDCGFERLDGYLFLGHGDSAKTLKDECVAARRAGLPVELIPQPPFNLKLGECIHFPHQAQFHPLKYLAGLARAFKRYKGRMFASTEATEIKGGKGTAEIKTKRKASISAGAVVVTTNTPVNDVVTMHTKQAAYRTYLIGAPVPVDSIPKALFWDTEDPFHYVRLHQVREAGGVRDVLIVGGEDHKTGQNEAMADRFARLTSWARTHFPGVKEIEFQWTVSLLSGATPAMRPTFTSPPVIAGWA